MANVNFTLDGAARQEIVVSGRIHGQTPSGVLDLLLFAFAWPSSLREDFRGFSRRCLHKLCPNCIHNAPHMCNCGLNLRLMLLSLSLTSNWSRHLESGVVQGSDSSIIRFGIHLKPYQISHPQEISSSGVQLF